jgi:beta-glucosidase/6-phospho-beta-glucosidase/beta-galactosidase
MKHGIDKKDAKSNRWRMLINVMLHFVINGTNVKGYFAWSFMDVFELLDGYRSR